MDKYKIIELINKYWRFDDNQWPLSNLHEKNDLITAIQELPQSGVSICNKKRMCVHKTLVKYCKINDTKCEFIQENN